MLGIEIDNFYKNDKLEYILEKNKEFTFLLKIFASKSNEYNLEFMNYIMSFIVQFYEFKYPDSLYYDNEKSLNYLYTMKISELLGIEQLKYHLYHDATYFLECNYCRHFILTQKINTYPYKREYMIRIENGLLNEYDVAFLKENIKTDNLTPKDLFNLINNKEDIDCNELKNLIEYHDNQVKLRNKLLELTALQMLYSKTTLPNYGYLRVKNFIKEFNNYYNLNLSLEPIDNIMNIDYQNMELKKIKLSLH